MKIGFIGMVALSVLNALPASAADTQPQKARWTSQEDANGSIPHVIDVLNQKLDRQLTLQDFQLDEDRDLAFNHYQRWIQVVNQVPVHGRSVRVWTELGTGKTVQVEAALEPGASVERLRFLKAETSDLSLADTLSLIRKRMEKGEKLAGAPRVRDEWRSGRLERSVRVRGKSGEHFARIDLRTERVVSYEFREFPQADLRGEQTLSANVYPIYEETDDNQLLERTPVELKHLLTELPFSQGDIYSALKTRHYYDFQADATLAATPAGRAEGYWSMAQLKAQAEKIRQELPTVPNDFAHGLLLQGTYATVQIHPDAAESFPNWGFKAQRASALFPNWVDSVVDGKDVSEMLPSQAYFGKPLSSAEEVLARPARRLPDHDAGQYLADGFDEIQVYYAIDRLFEELHSRGFKDPVLSTRPFNAFLFNPDIAYRDNAFYTDDTINFTTYSPKGGNMARDNTTIWHELGHGVMDRLMGDSIELADTGGLSEGMADFVAELVVQAVTAGPKFPGYQQSRIINNTGFFLTNEVHDDGEAYGGTMKDFQDAVIAQYGQADGLAKTADVVLEAMRLARDNPGLTAADWFSHVLFADELGRPGLRAAGELKPYLLQALAGRNFKLDGGETAKFSFANVKEDGTSEEISGGGYSSSGSPGSRGLPITVKLAQDGKAQFKLKAALTGSDAYAFHYPLQIRAQFNGGPLQGAIQWTGEEGGTRVYDVASETDTVEIPLEVNGKCQEVNRADGSCVDYVSVQIWGGPNAKSSIGKKRFYVRVKN